MKLYYKKEGLSRSLSRVEAEVAAAMTEFDTDRTGTLSFAEFLMLYAKGAPFRFQIPTAMRNAVIHLERQQRLADMSAEMRLKVSSYHFFLFFQLISY